MSHGCCSSYLIIPISFLYTYYRIYILPYIHIGVYTTIHIYAWRTIHIPDLPSVFILHSLLSIFPFPFLVSTSLFVRLLSSSTFILQRYRRQGTRQTPEQVLLTEKVFMTLRNQRLRFPENFYRPILCLMSP